MNLEQSSRLKNIIIIGSVLGALVTIYKSGSFFKDKLDQYAKETIRENFNKEKEFYRKEVSDVVGADPVGRFVLNSKWIDTIRAVYPTLKLDYRVMGMYINPKTKHRFYIDKNGIEFKVFKDTNGNYYYFDSKINFINP